MDNSLDLNVYGHWSENEKALLSDALTNGVKVISISLSNRMYQLFLEGYTCAEIANLNPPFTEKDVLYIRYRQKWDQKRDEYALTLQERIKQKIIKQKLESIEFLTNLLSVIHHAHKDSFLKFLQSNKEGEEVELPKLPSIKIYKDILEALDKVVGADKKVKVEGTMTHNVKVNDINFDALTTEQHTDLLDFLVKQVDKKKEV